MNYRNFDDYPVLAGIRIVLASGSPRRRFLLRERGMEFEVVEPCVEESNDAVYELDAPLANAALKADSVAAARPDDLVLGSDTVVVIDRRILGKPTDRGDALAMLETLAGRSHQVITAVSIRITGAGIAADFADTATVTFLPLDRPAIERYLELIHPFDKAGAYAAQEHADKIIARVDGDFNTVVGLPVNRTLAALAACAAARNA